MNASEQLSRLAPYVGRLLKDDYVHEQIGQAATSLRRGSRRAKRKGAKRAVADRRVRGQLRAGVTAATQVVRAVGQSPPPKRHPLRRVLVVTVAAGGAAVAYRQLSAGESQTRHG